ncbi:MAG: MBL fold metallo-hydrolase [Gemmatimonadetes bacterium]|nr:MBL fold metallo-hydrolase [Gemmatimonadota bacterium]
MSSKNMVVSFLNVGQGDATHIVFPNGEHMLVDINLDRKNGGIDVIQYLEDVLPKNGKKKPQLAVFVNTHPHDDHLRGIGELAERVDIKEVWHAGHELESDKGARPSYDEFLALLKAKGDDAMQLVAKSDAFRTVGDATVHVYRPSRGVKKKMSDTDQEQVVHDECAVLKLTYGGTSILLTGDSNLGAWKSIVKHYGGDLQAHVLSASHHGSRTFYKAATEDDEAYTEHLDAIAPETVVISVGADNPHDHPHTDMRKEYESRASVLHTADNLTVVATVSAEGAVTLAHGDADFQDTYQLPAPDDEKQSAAKCASAAAPAAATLTSRTRLGDVSKTA